MHIFAMGSCKMYLTGMIHKKQTSLLKYNDYQCIHGRLLKNSFFICFLCVHSLQAICFVAEAL